MQYDCMSIGVCQNSMSVVRNIICSMRIGVCQNYTYEECTVIRNVRVYLTIIHHDINYLVFPV